MINREWRIDGTRTHRQKASTTALERRASMVNASRLQSTDEPISLVVVVVVAVVDIHVVVVVVWAG
jgi:hypothetical protein